MVYDEWVSAIGQGVFTGLLAVLAIVAIIWCFYKFGGFCYRHITLRIQAKFRSRKIGKDENGNDGDKPKKDD